MSWSMVAGRAVTTRIPGQVSIATARVTPMAWALSQVATRTSTPSSTEPRKRLPWASVMMPATANIDIAE